MKTKYLVLIAILATAVSCSTLRTSYDYDNQVDFAAYKTYGFMEKGLKDLKINDLDKRRFISAISANLESRGMITSENPDVLINLIIVGKDRVEVNDTGMYGPYGWWGFGMYGGTMVRQYTEGTIYIDLVDNAQKKLVWQGKGVGEFNESVRDKDARIREAVNEIMENYPPVKK